MYIVCNMMLLLIITLLLCFIKKGEVRDMYGRGLEWCYGAGGVGGGLTLPSGQCYGISSQ